MKDKLTSGWPSSLSKQVFGCSALNIWVSVTNTGPWKAASGERWSRCEHKGLYKNIFNEHLQEKCTGRGVHFAWRANPGVQDARDSFCTFEMSVVADKNSCFLWLYHARWSYIGWIVFPHMEAPNEVYQFEASSVSAWNPTVNQMLRLHLSNTAQKQNHFGPSVGEELQCPNTTATVFWETQRIEIGHCVPKFNL